MPKCHEGKYEEKWKRSSKIRSQWEEWVTKNLLFNLRSPGNCPKSNIDLITWNRWPLVFIRSGACELVFIVGAKLLTLSGLHNLLCTYLIIRTMQAIFPRIGVCLRFLKILNPIKPVTFWTFYHPGFVHSCIHLELFTNEPSTSQWRRLEDD